MRILRKVNKVPWIIVAIWGKIPEKFNRKRGGGGKTGNKREKISFDECAVKREIVSCLCKKHFFYILSPSCRDSYRSGFQKNQLFYSKREKSTRKSKNRPTYCVFGIFALLGQNLPRFFFSQIPREKKTRKIAHFRGRKEIVCDNREKKNHTPLLRTKNFLIAQYPYWLRNQF